MSELNHLELTADLTTPAGNSIVLQSLAHPQDSEPEPEPKRKRRKAKASAEPQLAAEVLADDVLPLTTSGAELPAEPSSEVNPSAAATASTAATTTAATSTEPTSAEATSAEPMSAASTDSIVAEATSAAAGSSSAEVSLSAPETSQRAQNILQQLITAVQSQEAVVATQVQPVRTGDKAVAPMHTEAQAEVEEGPELSAAELERYNRMLLKAGDPCPACGQGTLVLRQSGKVAFLGCSCFPRCKLRYFTRTVSPVHTLKLLASLCPHCGAPLAVKKGRYGLFIGCSDYPNCTYSPKEAAEENAVECPQCHQGVLRQRRSSSGKIFYGCECYPACDFKLMGAPYLKTCPQCGFPLRFKKKVKAGIALVCGNPSCPTRKSRKYDLLSEQD